MKRPLFAIQPVRKLAVFFLLMVLADRASSQHYLLFSKKSYRQAIYRVGDVISFRVKAEQQKIRGQIIGFEDSLIVFRNYKINPKEITHLYVDKKTISWYILRYKYSRILLFSGAGYLLLDTLNTGELKEETLIISGSLIGAGLLAQLLISKKMKIRGRRKLIIVGK
jgi:hypothetical protein